MKDKITQWRSYRHKKIRKPQKDQKYPILRENFNQTSKRRFFLEILLYGTTCTIEAPLFRKKFAENQTAVPSRGPLSVPSRGPFSVPSNGSPCNNFFTDLWVAWSIERVKNLSSRKIDKSRLIWKSKNKNTNFAAEKKYSHLKFHPRKPIFGRFDRYFMTIT